MYKISNVKVDGFWHRCTAESSFNDEVNVIIGQNGTGKTTFMNILHSVLAVDVDGISNNDFESIEIQLMHGRKRKTVRARKIEDERFPFVFVEYQISRNKYKVRLITSDDRRMAMAYRRKSQEESSEVRKVLGGLVSLSSISVYRLRNDDEYEIRDKHGSRLISPVDYRLREILRGLTHYQLSISQDARSIATKLQKDVLTSILYSEEDAEQKGYQIDFDKDKEKTKLVTAYSQLNAIDADVRKKISFHVNAIDESLSALAHEMESSRKENRDLKSAPDAFRSLEALRKTRKIIELSLEAERDTNKVFAQLQLFLSIVKSFIKDKDFSFKFGDLSISNKQGEIDYGRLSSGEKQLLILLSEALLQDQKPHIFLADEPELSLHIEWQRKIIPAVRELNPNAQVIAATHSPEVAAHYKDFLMDMGEIVRG